jgi:hypothetical protein
MQKYMKSNLRNLLVLFSILIVSSCASFKPATIDETTGQFPASAEVDQKYIKILQPLAGIKEVNYVYLRARSPYGGDRFYDFMKDALIKIGFKKVYSARELSQMVIQSGLSTYVTNLSDLISLNNLAKATGPFIIFDSTVYPVTDVVFRFDVQVIEPLSGNTYLEISRIRTNWLDMDKEINYPILNVIKQWYDESAKLPFKKPEDRDPKEGTI